MRGRRRSPADRPGPAGVGAARSDHRGFRPGVGFRRTGQPKPSSYAALPPPPPPPPPPPRLRYRDDVLREAGRLAAEYLVAKGLLPASSLPANTAARLWPPSGGGEDGERASALSRLGRRRLEDDDDGGFGGRKKARRRRNRSGSDSCRGSEWGRENGRGVSWTETWAERGRGYSDAMDDEDLDRSGRRSARGKGSLDAVYPEDSDRQDRSEDSDGVDGGGGGRGTSKAATTDELLLPSKSDVPCRSELELKDHNSADKTDSKAIEVCEAKKDPVPGAEMVSETRSGDIKVSDWETEEVEEGKVGVEASREDGLQLEKEEGLAVKSCPAMEDKQLSNHGISLLCGSVKSPTKPRSSVTHRIPRTDQKLSIGDVRENSDVLKEGGLDNKAEEVSIFCPSNNSLTDQSQSSRGLASKNSMPSTSTGSLTKQLQSSRDMVLEVSRSQSALLPESVEYCFMQGSENRRCRRSHSLSESSSFADAVEETNEGPPGFELSRKSIDAKIDEGPAEHVKGEGMKQPQEWLPSSLSKMDEYLQNLRLKQVDIPVKKLPQDHEMVDATEQDQVEIFPQTVVKSVNKFEEQSQLASNSFKICDLNLMEAPEITDISNAPVLEHVPTSAVSLETENNPSVSFDSSICQRGNQRGNETDSHDHHSSDNKVIPVIDLEDDSPVEVNACDTSQTRSNPIYPNLENFLNNSGNPGGLSTIQDGYGLAISKFLGNDIAACPAVQGGISDMQAFHGAEGIAGNDDSLYVNLGEIPLNFMEVWDQPPPEYEKFF